MTNAPSQEIPNASCLDRIRIVMVRSRSPGNVGSAARAMKNFGLSKLVLAALPNFDDPEFFATESRKLAWRARDLLETVEKVEDLETALAGTHFALGTAPRELQGARTLTPRQAARELVEEARAGRQVALVFGGEADGLRNHEHSQLAGIVRIPTGEAYQDLNLAQSIVVCGYEIFQAHQELRDQAPAPSAQEDPASFEEFQGLLQATQELLTEAGFFKTPGETLIEELQRVAGRARFSSREVKVFRGVLRQLGWSLRNGPGEATVPVPRPG
jgi:TrmH family RNA methyltransferase